MAERRKGPETVMGNQKSLEKIFGQKPEKAMFESLKTGKFRGKKAEKENQFLNLRKTGKRLCKG